MIGVGDGGLLDEVARNAHRIGGVYRRLYDIKFKI